MKKILSIFAAVLFAGSMMAAEYVKVDFASIRATDNVIITMTKSEKTYALVNLSATGTNPKAAEVTVAGDKISTDVDTLSWNIVTVEDSLVLYPAGQTTIWLSYSSSSSSNALRVKSDKLNGFVYDEGYLKPKSRADRYVGLNSGATLWGQYAQSTVSSQTLAFYKKDKETAIDNTAVETSALKTIENGQLVVIKNGVKYNVLGSVIE